MEGDVTGPQAFEEWSGDPEVMAACKAGGRDATGPVSDRDAETDESPEETARRVRLTVERNMAGRFRPEDAWAVEAVIADITREHLPGASPPDSSAAPVAGDGQVVVDRGDLERVLSAFYEPVTNGVTEDAAARLSAALASTDKSEEGES